MRNAVTSAVGEDRRTEPITILKRIGSTKFIVTVHFNNSGNETLEDKLLRLIKREVSKTA